MLTVFLFSSLLALSLGYRVFPGAANLGIGVGVRNIYEERFPQILEQDFENLNMTADQKFMVPDDFMFTVNQ